MEEVVGTLTRGLDIEAHPTELAIIVKFGLKREQKIIYLKDLTSSVDSSVVARFVLDKCPIIPAHRAPDVEQIIHYLQKRASGHSTDYSTIKTTTNTAAIKATLEEVDSYIELLYEDADKIKGTAHVLALSNNPLNLQHLINNEVLMAALTRVFREDSKKNFELATNIAVVFLRFSEFRQFLPILAHFKVGTLAMQLIENELKRGEIWKGEANAAFDKSKKKWEFAIQRQDELIGVLLQILLNLADDLKVELKMIKRGILPMLLKCLEKHAPNLQIAAVKFLWKLSIFVENKDFMASNGIVEKLMTLFPTNSAELMNVLYSLLFNLSFDANLRTVMVSSGLVPFVAPAIDVNPTALCLLYQLSILDDAKAMITFTDAISTLMKILTNNPEKLVVKGLLINVSIEKRNAQLICSSDGKGLQILMDQAFLRSDVLLMKICRNISAHEGAMQELFQKYLRKLLKISMENVNKNDGKNYLFSLECLATAAKISTSEWSKIANELDLISWIKNKLQLATSKNFEQVSDDFLLQIIILTGSIALNPATAQMLVPIVPILSKLIENKPDDEIVLQIVYTFYCLLTHSEIANQLCSDDGIFVESLICLMNNPNQQLRNMCEQALQFIAESNEYWKKRVIEERFKFHNLQWIDMVKNTKNDLTDQETGDDDVNNVILGSEDILNQSNL